MQDLVCTRIRGAFRAEDAQVIRHVAVTQLDLRVARERKEKAQKGEMEHCSLCSCENNGACPMQA